MNVKKITKAWLKENGYDGLYSEECGCNCDDLMPCTPNEGVENCEAGYQYSAPKETGFDYFIGSKEARDKALEERECKPHD